MIIDPRILKKEIYDLKEFQQKGKDYHFLH